MVETSTADAGAPARVKEHRYLPPPKRDVGNVLGITSVVHWDCRIGVAGFQGIRGEGRANGNGEINSMYNRKRREQKRKDSGGKSLEHAWTTKGE